MSYVAALLSLVVPGLGQLVRGRFVEALLFLVSFGYVRLLLAGLAGDAEGARMSGFFFGAFGVEGGTSHPTFVVFSVLIVFLHGAAAWHAFRSREQVAVVTLTE